MDDKECGIRAIKAIIDFKGKGLLIITIKCMNGEMPKKMQELTLFCPGFQKDRVPSEKGTFSVMDGQKGTISVVN